MGPGAPEDPTCLRKQAASVHGVPEAASEKHVPFGDGTKHLCSSAAQMFARCVILSTNKPRGKKKKKSGRVLYTLMGPRFKSNGHYVSLISCGDLAASPNANWGYLYPAVLQKRIKPTASKLLSPAPRPQPEGPPKSPKVSFCLGCVDGAGAGSALGKRKEHGSVAAAAPKHSPAGPGTAQL